MIDVRLLRTDLDGVKKAMARRGIDVAPLDEAAALDARLRELAGRRDVTRQEINDASKRVGRLRHEGKVAEAEALQAESRALGEREQQLAAEATELEAALRELLLRIPNIPSAEAPDGVGEADNPVVQGRRATSPTPSPSTSGCRTGRSAPRSASSTTSGR